VVKAVAVAVVKALEVVKAPAVWVVAAVWVAAVWVAEKAVLVLVPARLVDRLKVLRPAQVWALVELVAVLAGITALGVAIIRSGCQT
jgi:hypothetical protein